MRTSSSKTWLLAVALCAVGSCGPFGNGGDDGLKRTYSLCGKSPAARATLHKLVQDFARRSGSKLTDRGSEAQEELAAIESDVLNSTGGNAILLTIDRPNHYRVSVTNLGSRQKLALTVRTWSDGKSDPLLSDFLAELEKSWVTTEIQGGVQDHPPCSGQQLGL